MNYLEEYDKTFIETFKIEKGQLKELEYQSIPEWDSVGHMQLIAEIEEIFDIMFDTDDIVGFSSYKIGKEILLRYEVSL